MTLQQLKYLLALEQYGAIRKAAQGLFISQPSISVAIQELEAELGFPVICRTYSGVTFTVKGKLVLEQAKIVMNAIERIHDLGKDGSQKLNGIIHLGGNARFTSRILMDAITELNQENQELEIRLESTGSAKALCLLIAGGKLDGGFAMVESFGENMFLKTARQNNLVFEKMFTDEILFLMSRRHPLAARHQASLSELLAYPFVSMQRDADFRQSEKYKFFAAHGYHGKTIFINNLSEIERYLLNADSRPLTILAKKDFDLRKKELSEEFTCVHISDCEYTCKGYWIQRANWLQEPVSSAIREALLRRCATL